MEHADLGDIPATCPHCSGTGNFFAMWDGEGGSGIRTFECLTCAGSGKITAAQLLKIHEGKSLREARLVEGKTLSEAAAERGITAAQLSALEWGR